MIRPGLSLVVMLAICCFGASASAASQGQYVGADTCASCHETETSLWQGSQHAQAMQVAHQGTVLGDFEQASLQHYGITSRFFRNGDRFMVNTEGPDGKLHDFPVRYTFGVYPLQQYIVELPGGRLQALDVAWDSRKQEQGGQRWFALHDDERIAPDDVLHWTGPNLNWNYMCAECHSTNLRKQYDAAGGTYETSWSEINVSCEACHGPGLRHVEWAQTGASKEAADKGLDTIFNERYGVHWSIDQQTGKPVRSVPRETSIEIETCAVCHSRRSQIAENEDPGQRYFDTFIPALLTEDLYYVDGQIDEEVYVYGSFLQSRMHRAGVTCSDCHDVHAADLKLPGEQVCYQCHARNRYANRRHHFHDQASTGASCVECHMPPKTFMKVDPRHDHSFRIPRPDQSVRLGTPNACNQCHKDKTALWATRQVKEWYGTTPVGDQRFATALHAGRRQLPDARERLQALASNEGQPGIARATAVSMLGSYPDVDSFSILKQMADSDDPQQRLAALQALASFDPRNAIQIAFPLLDDPLRSVRIRAARLLAPVPAGQLSAERQDTLDKATQEYIQAQRFNAERPESQLNLGSLYTDQGNDRDAEAAFNAAIELQPKFVPAYVNLARLYSRSQGDEQAALQILGKGLEHVPDSAELHHAMGLALVRDKNLPAALDSLSQAAELVPENARYGYVYAVALQSSGHIDGAIQVLESVHGKHPGNTDVLVALVTFNREAGNRSEAHRYASILHRLYPDDSVIEQLVRQLGQ